MHATRLRGAGRPKVVNIPRTISSSTTSTSALNGSRTLDRPSTPNRPCQEVSVFSPDTPTTHSRRASRYSITSLRRVPLTPRGYRGHNFASPQRSSPRHSSGIRNSLERSFTESQDTFATDSSDYTVRSPMRTPPPVLSPTSEAVAWVRCTRLESILEAVSQAMETFPDGMLRLDSPAILALRPPHSLDKMYIDALQRIFPQTASLLLSALAALLIVDSYFSSLGGISTAFCNSPHDQSKRTYGMLAARSNECVQDIPIKARVTLGIQLPNLTDLQDQERALRKRAGMVAVCVGVQGQRLLEAVCGRFDEVTWRALKVLVETLESSNRSQR
jgi:hypothetical protein